MPHTLINQLRFARSEFVRCLEGISDEDARHRFMPMNCISWMVGHMAAQEQFYFVFFPQGKVPHPQLNELVGFGHPATTPPLDEMWQVWHDITAIADTFLDTVTPDQLIVYPEQSISAFEESAFGTVTKKMLEQKTIRSSENHGTKMQRTTYHYFFPHRRSSCCSPVAGTPRFALFRRRHAGL